MSYAPFLAAAFLLWPLTSMTGTQGNAPLVLLASIPALFVARPRAKPASYLLVAIAFLIWAMVSETWAPGSRGFVSGSLFSGDLAIRSAGLRMALVVIFGTLLIAGALHLKEGQAQISSRIMLGAISIHGLMVMLSPWFGATVLPIFYGDDPARYPEGFQNIDRGANAFALVLPILVAYLGVRSQLGWKLLAFLMIAASAFSFALLGVSAAMIGSILLLFAIAIVYALPKQGVRVLFTCAAAYIALAPFIVGGLIQLIYRTGISLPPSFQSRVWSWDVVVEKIREKPLTGHGMDAAKTWRDTYAEYPDWLAQLPDFWAYYPVIPGHPHNMALQIWAETGGVGAVLAALALLLTGWSLPRGDKLRADIRYATGGILVTGMCLFSFSYSVWNDAFWSSAILAVGALILLSRRRRASMA